MRSDDDDDNVLGSDIRSFGMSSLSLQAYKQKLCILSAMNYHPLHVPQISVSNGNNKTRMEQLF